MSDASEWLARYAARHQNLTHPVIYWAAVPTVVLGTVGMLWALPVPDAFHTISPLLNWGSTFLMAAVIYYFIISLSLAIGLLPFVLGVALFEAWLVQSDYSLARVAVGLFTAGVIGLGLGHRNQSSFRPVVEDLQMMMLGPAWILSRLYQRLGIPL